MAEIGLSAGRLRWLAVAANDLHALITRRWITDACAGEYGLAVGILHASPPAVPEHWRRAAIEWRQQKYGPGGLLEREGA